MEFDFAQVGVPFRMRPDLRRLQPDARHLTALRPGSALHTEKLALQRSGGTRLALAGFDPSLVLAEIRVQALRADVPEQSADALPLELQVEEDLVLLDTTTGTIPWMAVSVPSRWAPEEKLGQTLSTIHSPVADAEALASALPHLLRVLANGTHWERHVWTISPSARYDQHPYRHARPLWPDTLEPAAFVQQCFFRAERQTFLPLVDASGRPCAQVLFTIQVMVEPLLQVIARRADALRLYESIASMSSAVLAYKSLTPARERLLHWLSACHADEPDAVPKV